MAVIFPQRLQVGDEVRIIAPARCLRMIGETNIAIHSVAKQQLMDLGLKVSFGKNIEAGSAYKPGSVQERIDDLHDAFRDTNVKCIFGILGGVNDSCQLLPHLDYDLIRNNPKFLLGYSDLSTLENGIFSKTGVVTYYGPTFSTLGMKEGGEYTLLNLKRVLFGTDVIPYVPSETWSDDYWFLYPDNRTFHKNDGPFIVNGGTAKGHVVGGEMKTLEKLFGTEFMPSLEDSILMIELALPTENSLRTFDESLQSFIHLEGFGGVRGIILGRFRSEFKISLANIVDVVKHYTELTNIPIIANVDFGHTHPMLTLPVGGTVEIDTSKTAVFAITRY